MFRIWSVVALPALLAATCGAAERWQVQYFYDTGEDTFVIADLAFPSATRGFAAGALTSKTKNRPMAVATADGGRTWKPIEVPDAASSLFFLDENAGWLVGRKGLWHTTDSGRTWKKLNRPADLMRVYFLTPDHGFAVGAKKSIHETFDGGSHWKAVPAAAEPKSTPDHTVYDCVAFADGQRGLIAGWSKPPRRGDSRRLPDWMDPQARRREWPSLLILLQTWDSGKQWKPTETSMFGQVTRLRLAPDGRGLGLIEFFDQFDWPSEVFKIDWRTGQSSRVFREKNRVVTDVALPANGPAWLAAVEPSGTMSRSPIPGKLKMLRSNDLEHWTEVPVDYRAVAHQAVLASPGAADVWVATDTGMILRLAVE